MVQKKCGKGAIINRLKRIEGQARGIQRMIAEDAGCFEVISQLNALDSAVRNASKAVLGEYLQRCFKDDISNGKDIDSTIDKMTELLLKSKL